jgi:hypothetical protein
MYYILKSLSNQSKEILFLQPTNLLVSTITEIFLSNFLSYSKILMMYQEAHAVVIKDTIQLVSPK